MKALIFILSIGALSLLSAQKNTDSLTYSNFKSKPTLQTDLFDAYLNFLAIVDDTVNARNYLETKFFKDQKAQVGGFNNVIVENRVFANTKVSVEGKEYYFFYEPGQRSIPLQIIFIRKPVSILSVLNTLLQKKLL